MSPYLIDKENYEMLVSKNPSFNLQNWGKTKRDGFSQKEIIHKNSVMPKLLSYIFEKKTLKCLPYYLVL